MTLKKITLMATCALLAGSAHATVQVFNFSGTIAQSNSTAIGGPTNTAVGQTFSGQFSYDDTSLPDGVLGSGIPVGNTYYYQPAQISFTSPLGSAAGTGNINRVYAPYSGVQDKDQLVLASNPVGDFNLIVLNGFIAPTGSVGAALPSSLAGESFSFNAFGPEYIFNGTVIVGANATATVPEPASWAMMVGGFGLIGGAMRRRQQLAIRFA